MWRLKSIKELAAWACKGMPKCGLDDMSRWFIAKLIWRKAAPLDYVYGIDRDGAEWCRHPITDEKVKIVPYKDD